MNSTGGTPIAEDDLPYQPWKPEEIHYFKWCTENGIRIYPVPIWKPIPGNYYIVVERNGKASKGKLILKTNQRRPNPSMCLATNKNLIQK